MSSQTPNINLTLPTGAEKVSRQIINDNNTKIDTAIGTLNSKLNSAIPANTNIGTLSSGDYQCAGPNADTCTGKPSDYPSDLGFSLHVVENSSTGAKYFILQAWGGTQIWSGYKFASDTYPSWGKFFRSNLFNDTSANSASALMLAKYNLVKDYGVGTYMISGGWSGNQFGVTIVSINSSTNSIVVFFGSNDAYKCIIQNNAVANLQKITTTSV